jgi:hypothetical protein
VSPLVQRSSRSSPNSQTRQQYVANVDTPPTSRDSTDSE